STSASISEPGMPAFPSIGDGRAATTFPLGSSSKARTTCRTSPCSTRPSRGSCARSGPHTRPCATLRWSGVATSLRGARRIPVPRSTGSFAGASAPRDHAMKLIALLFGLALEHAATRRFRLRELRFFDPYFDFALARVTRLSVGGAAVVLAAFLLLAIAPVLWIDRVLEETFIPWDLPYLAFAVLVVFLCLGPRDLGSEVDDYCAALARGDRDEARRVMTALTESQHARPLDVDAVEEAIFVQATNRIFGVAFWFVVLGPVGAWLFRVSDLLRRRAAFESARDYGVARAGLPA